MSIHKYSVEKEKNKKSDSREDNKMDKLVQQNQELAKIVSHLNEVSQIQLTLDDEQDGQVI